MLKLEDYIQVVPGVLTKKDCAEIVKILKTANKWVGARFTDDARRSVTDVEVRNCDTTMVSELKTSDTALARVDAMLFNAAKKALEGYMDVCNVYDSISMDTGYEALRYKKGGFYIEHVDAFNTRPRVLSCSFSLNDSYEGGEFAFFGGEFKVRAPAGSAVLFPSNFCFPHQILPVTKGTRCSVVTWFQ